MTLCIATPATLSRISRNSVGDLGTESYGIRCRIICAMLYSVQVMRLIGHEYERSAAPMSGSDTDDPQ